MCMCMTKPLGLIHQWTHGHPTTRNES